MIAAPWSVSDAPPFWGWSSIQGSGVGTSGRSVPRRQVTSRCCFLKACSDLRRTRSSRHSRFRCCSHRQCAASSSPLTGGSNSGSPAKLKLTELASSFFSPRENHRTRGRAVSKRARMGGGTTILLW